MQTKTESAVVAEFRGFSEAGEAVRELEANAFAGDHIHVTSDLTQASAPADVPLPQCGGAGHYEKDVRQWLESMFGQNADTDQGSCENALHAGRVLVGVTTPEQMLDRAADILSHHSPVHVYQKPACEYLATSIHPNPLRSERAS
jgi:hypothetical protein